MPPTPAPDPNELVLIKHPDVKALGGPVPRSAFDDVWSAKGWKVASDKDVADDSASSAGKE